MPRQSVRLPSDRLHKPPGQAVVTLNGEDHYLGLHGTDASRAAYDRLVGQWQANGRRPLEASPAPTTSRARERELARVDAQLQAIRI